MARLVGSLLIAGLIVGQIAWLVIRDSRTSQGSAQAAPKLRVPTSQDDFSCAEEEATPSESASATTVAAQPPAAQSTKTPPTAKLEPTSSKDKPASAPAPRELADLVRETVVRVALPNTESVGTGFITRLREDGFDVVTAAHIVNGDRPSSIGQSIEVTSYFNQALYQNEVPAKDETKTSPKLIRQPTILGRVHRMVWLAAQDKVHDVAVLRIVSKEKPTQTLTLDGAATEGEAANEPVVKTPRTAPFDAWQIRWSPEELPTLGQAAVVRKQLAEREPNAPKIDYWICSPASIPGMSGGPLMTPDGKVLGVASGNSGGEAYYIPIEAAVALMNRANHLPAAGR